MSEIISAQGNARRFQQDVYIELRLATTKGSKVGITVGVSGEADSVMVDEAVALAKGTLEQLCEEYNRLDDLTRHQQQND